MPVSSRLPSTAAFLACLFFAAALAPVACTSPRTRTAAASAETDDDRILGKWTGDAGRIAGVARGTDSAYSITLADEKGTRTLPLNLITIDYIRFCEIKVFDANSKDAVPVYHYGKLDISADRIIHSPIRAAWLETAAHETSGTAYTSTSQVQAGSGGMVARDPAIMRAVLAKATKDPNAFDKPESCTRVK